MCTQLVNYNYIQKELHNYLRKYIGEIMSHEMLRIINNDIQQYVEECYPQASSIPVVEFDYVHSILYLKFISPYGNIKR